MSGVKDVLTGEFWGVVVGSGSSGQGEGGDVHAEGMPHDDLHGEVVTKHVGTSEAGEPCFRDGWEL